MATVAHVDARYTADTTVYVRQVKAAQKATQEFAGAMPQADKAMADVSASSVALGSALGLLAAQGLTRATAKVKEFAMQGINAAKDYEQTVISIEGIFAGMGMSVEEATTKTAEYLADLRDFAAKTPFELPQTLDAVKRLLSIGYAADDVKDRLLPTIGDIVSALGQPPQSISAVVYAFGQMKSAGRVLTQDLMQIGNALPGFNAKMAIATEMFEGDMNAFNAAMEKGAVESNAAIDAILSAMQKFGGAQGAMERQSETLAGVMSTFSDTVNNALIDGLMPSIPVLSATLNEVMPAVEGVATAFAQSLGPALISGAQVMGELAPTAAAIIPPVIELISQLTVAADAMAAMAPIVEMLANVLGFIADAMKALPAPIFAAIGAMVLIRLAMKKLNIESMQTTGKLAAQFKVAARAVQVQAASINSSLTGVQVKMRTLGVVGATAVRGLSASLKAAGAAVKGFMLSLGPVGWAITAATVAMEIFMGKSAETEERIASLRDTIDETTGALTDLTATQITSNLYDLYDDDDVNKLAKAGVYLGDLANAIVAGGEVSDNYRKKLLDLKQSYIDLGTVGGEKMAQLLRIVIDDFDEQAAAAGEVTDAFRREKEAKEESANSSIALMQATLDYRDSAVRAKQRTDELASAEHAAAQQATATQEAQAALEERMLAAAEAAQAMDDALKSLSSNLSAAKSAWTAEESLAAIAEEAEKSGGALMGTGKKARSFQKVVVDAMSDAASTAEQLGGTAEETRDLFVGQMALIVQSLVDNGIKKKDVEAFLGTFADLPVSVDEIMIAASAAAGKAADGFQTQVSKDISKAWETGEILSIAAAENMAESAASEARQKLGMELAPELQAAINYAKDQVGPTAFAGGKDIGFELGRGEIAGIVASMPYIDEVARQAVRRAEQAAKDEAGIASPSKVFMEIGADLMAGLNLGVNKGAPGFSESVARAVQDAVWAAADAADRVADAQKRLNELRAEGASAREIAAAERDLAKARRDAADAAAAQAQAEADLEAARKLANRPIGKKPFEKTADMLGAGDIEAAWDFLEQYLMDRAKQFGLSGQAAADYVSAALGAAFDATEKDQRRLSKLVDRLANVRDRIERVRAEIEARAAEREKARGEFETFFESLFGEESEFEKAYDSASISVDKAADLFKDLSDLIEQRFTGAKDTTERDNLVSFLEEQTEQLVGLIKQRDDLIVRLRAEQSTLDSMLRERAQAEDRLRDSIESFFKPSGKITSADEYITGLQQRVDATRQYMANIDDLRKRGVGESTIEQILSMGPEAGGSLAAALSGATDEQLEYVNALTAQSETMASNFATTQADIMYGAGIEAQQQLVAGLQSEYDGVIAEIETVTAGIQEALLPLADESYDVGALMGEQLLEGLLEKEAQIISDIEDLGMRINAAWAQALGSAWTAPGGTGRTNRIGVVSAPMAVPTSVGGGMTVSPGAVQVQINVADGQTASSVQSAVSAGVQEALAEVARRARNSRR